MRAEILLMAFAQDVITKGAEGQVVIKGKVEESAKVWRLIDSRPGWKRAVAFRLASQLLFVALISMALARSMLSSLITQCLLQKM